MNTEPLEAMTQYRQWINWKEVPDATKPKPIKVPCDSHGNAINAHDTRYHLTFDESNGCGLPVAFVFTDNDPFFFVDIDGCLQADNTWSPFANDLMNRFNGAAVEVSHSGKGLHIFGMTSNLQTGHRTKDSKLGLEIYTTRRFVALGTGQIGNANVDCTNSLAQALNDFLPGKSFDASGADWTMSPVPDWSGPIDDDELIQVMLRARSSAESAFGSKASFVDLWDADQTALAAAFPDDTGNTSRGFDASSADMALMMHLAFWTGKDCERMKRLFERSSLMSFSKWHKRPDYQRATVVKCAALCQTVYQRPDLTATPTGVEPAQQPVQAPHEPIMRPGYQFLTVEGCVKHFTGCVYVRDIHKIFTPDGGLLGPEQFKAMYGGYDFQTSLSDRSKPTKSAFEAFVGHMSISFPKVHRTAFRPELPSGAVINEEGLTLVNTYVPATINETNEDVTPFLNHMTKLIPDEHDLEILMSYGAAIKQYPGSKFQWSPVIQGTPGNGKSLFMRCVAKSVGERYTHLPNAKELADSGGKFTAWLENKLFIGVEEIHVRGRQEVAEVLTALITNDKIEIQSKGANQVMGDNRANFVFCSNYRDAVIKNENDRRYCVFYTAQQTKADMFRDGMLGVPGTPGADYFPDLYNWLRGGGYAAVAGYLRNYQIKSELNPAVEFGGRCQWAPDTTSTARAIIETLGPIEQAIQEAVAEGRDGFKGEWISSIKLDEFLKETGKSRALPNNRRAAVLLTLEYIPHPALRHGRATRPMVQEGNRKPVLYVRNGSIAALNIFDGSEAVETYLKAQGWVPEAAQDVG